MSRSSCALAALTLLSSPGAADVHTVGSPGLSTGDFDSIQAAVDAASDGDTILLKFGKHRGFVIDGKSLDIVPRAIAAYIAGPVTVRNVPAGGRVVLQELQFRPLPDWIAGDDVLVVEDNEGLVWLQDCYFELDPTSSLAPISAARVLTFRHCADVVISHTAVWPSGVTTAPVGTTALHFEDSQFVVYGSQFTGGVGTSVPDQPPTPGGTGLRAISSSGLLAGVFIEGGRGGSSNFNYCKAGDGGAGLALDGIGSDVRAVGGAQVGGAAGTGTCGSPQDGDDLLLGPQVQWNSFPGEIARIDAAPSWVAGTGHFLQFLYTGGGGKLAVLLVALGPGHLEYPIVPGAPGLLGTLLIEPPLVVDVLGLPDPFLPAIYKGYVVPPLPRGAASLQIFLQALEIELDTFTATLGATQILQLLDASF